MLFVVVQCLLFTGTVTLNYYGNLVLNTRFGTFGIVNVVGMIPEGFHVLSAPWEVVGALSDDQLVARSVSENRMAPRTLVPSLLNAFFSSDLKICFLWCAP